MPSLPSVPGLPELPTNVVDLWNATSKLPQGKKIFSVAFSQKAPYFATIRPTFSEIRPNYAELKIKKRRGVQNHIGTVHAIALCNGLEAAMGALAEASIPADKRWIPKGMDITYTAKASSDIRCIAETDPEQWTSDNPDLHVRVKGLRKDDTVVIEGVIKLWVTEKPAKK
ncbi:MAG TPA: hotdog fold domain-containing protein [Nocardioidaceae bacterium]|nr:hotdog fold domain-containing protein [Nocardioidaceae bacterium]